MSKNKLKIGEISKPRFEFRTFGQDFSESSKLMEELSIPVPEKVRHRQSDEIYIVSRTSDINNTKIRDGKMDIKTYVQTIDGLEQWNPLMKAEFPISSEILKNDVFPAFQVEMPELIKDEYSMSEFLDMINANPSLQAVNVHKERFGYMVNDTICEVANVLINGAKVVTINSESTEIEDIKKTMNDVNLNNIENINYLQVIKRVIGMINKPLAN
jgi:ribosomal protein L30/L7E